jgi:hypothetical protein
MSHKIFVHIGLPKTATTSLQTDFFPKLEDGEIKYFGVVQPRHTPVQSELYRAFLKATGGHGDLAGLRESLLRILERETVILSEELILVSWHWITWKEKLANLKKILDGLDYEIVVTVREPASALFSYYCEIFPRLGADRSSFLDCALQNEALQIFHYNKLISELARHFSRKRLHFFKYEELITNNTRDLIQLLAGAKPKKLDIHLGNHNQRSKDQAYVSTPNYFTAADLILRVFPSLSPSGGNSPPSKTLALLLKLTRNLRLSRIRINIPEPHVMNQLRESLREDNRTLDQWFGLKY